MAVFIIQAGGEIDRRKDYSETADVCHLNRRVSRLELLYLERAQFEQMP